MAKAKKAKGKLTSAKASVSKPAKGKAKAKASSVKTTTAKPAASKKVAKSKPVSRKAEKPLTASKLKLNKPLERPVQAYNLFEDLETQELMYMLSLKPAERFAQLRSFIKTAYGIRGYDPENLPKKRTIRIIEYKGKPL